MVFIPDDGLILSTNAFVYNSPLGSVASTSGQMSEIFDQRATIASQKESVAQRKTIKSLLNKNLDGDYSKTQNLIHSFVQSRLTQTHENLDRKIIFFSDQMSFDSALIESPEHQTLVDFLKRTSFDTLMVRSLKELSHEIERSHQPDLLIFDFKTPISKGPKANTQKEYEHQGLWAIGHLALFYPEFPIMVILPEEMKYLEPEILKLGAKEIVLQRPKTLADDLILGIRKSFAKEEAERFFSNLNQSDPLTHLMTRRALKTFFDTLIIDSKFLVEDTLLILIDLDNFKFINDSLGREFGDKCLRKIADKISHQIPFGSKLCRYGGDSFAILAKKEFFKTKDGHKYKQSYEKFIRDLKDDLNFSLSQEESTDIFDKENEIDSNKAIITTSIGVAEFNDNINSFDQFLNLARTNLLVAKNSGKNRIGLPENNSFVFLADREQGLKEIRRAFDNQEIYLKYQPKVSMGSKKVYGVEALLRWNHPTEGELSPTRFIPLLEKTGLIHQLGSWLLEKALVELKDFTNLEVAVNVSAVQFGVDFYKTVRRILKDAQFPPQRLCIELTEGILMSEQEKVFEQLEKIKALGVKISIDDFGTGFSSLSYLNRFPVDEIKIDRSFITNICHDFRSAAIANSIINLGHHLGVKVVAEGVEQQDQLEFLEKSDCDQYQGNYFSVPIHLQDLSSLL